MKYFVILLVLVMTVSLSSANDVFAQAPGDEMIIRGNYTSEEFGFSIALPDSLDGFLTEFDIPSVGKIVKFQIHPETEVEICCPPIDSSPIAILFDNNPKEYYSIPAPMTNGILASFQGYGLDVKIENLGDYQVLTSTLDYEREFREFPEPVKRVGKFYFINAGDRYISYGILASEENYEKYIQTFENSAKSLDVKNAIPVNLDELFPDKHLQAELRLDDNSSMFPKITTPSTVTSLTATKSSQSLQINFTEPNDFRSFLAINVGDLLEGPYEITFNGKKADSQILENESGKYLIVFYSGQGQHSIRISGSSINSISNPPYQIENINSTLYYVSESLDLNPDSGKIIFKDVIFKPHILDPPRQTYSFVTFADEKKEALLVGFDEPVFTENTDPQAGFVKRTNGYHPLVSVNLKDMPPLKQFKEGIPVGNVECKDDFVLIQKHGGPPACVTRETGIALERRDWGNLYVLFSGEYVNPISNIRVTDSFGKALVSVDVNQDARIKVDLQNILRIVHPYVMHFQITDPKGNTETSVIEGTLKESESLEELAAWMPKQSGEYKIEVSLWEDIDKKIPIGIPQTITANVN